MTTEAEFERVAARYRRELFAHCYRMLGSPHDAEDALQEAMLAAWRGLRTFEGRASIRAWLYRVTTNACLRYRSRRTLVHGAPFEQTADLGQWVSGPVWIEPLAEDSHAIREDVELAWIAALQHLPGSQRAVLILRDVLEFSAAETAEVLELTVPAANSALQRARAAIAARVPPITQAEELSVLGEEGARELVGRLVAAWEAADVPALLELLTEDARLTMPPLPAWFDGRDRVAMFFAERIFAHAWQLVPVRANGQLGVAGYMDGELGGINVLTVRGGRVSAIDSFLDPAVGKAFRLGR